MFIRYRLIITHENKKLRPYKLIVGGNGVVSKFPDTDQYFADWNKQNNFIEHLIIGDGETPLGKLFSKGQITYDNDNIDSFPFPTYQGYDLNDYEEKKVSVNNNRLVYLDVWRINCLNDSVLIFLVLYVLI